MKRVGLVSARLIVVLCFLLQIRAQEEIRTSFEEFPVFATPPFVHYHQPGRPAVADSSISPFIQAPDGQKYLYAGGAISIQSPNSQPIISYSLLLYLPATGSQIFFGIFGQTGPVLYNTWQKFEGTFQVPQTELQVSAFVVNGGETFGTSYYIDDIHFITVPEPADWTLFGLGAIAIFLLDQRRRRTNLTA